VVGCGRIAQAAHLPALARTPQVRLAALCDPREDLLRQVCAAYGGVRGYLRLEELLADPQIAAVHLCVPTPEHAPAALAALEAGKDVLIEKPLASTVDAGRRILEAARRTRQRVMVGYHKRYDAGCERARALMPEVGPPTYLFYRFGTTDWLAPSAATLFSTAAAPQDPASWGWPAAASTPELRELHALVLDMFTHMTNLLRWLTGERPQVEWARVGEGTPAGAGKSSGMTRALLALRFGTAPALLVDGPHYPSAQGWNERCEVWGPGGRLELDLPPNAWMNAAARVRFWDASSGETREPDPGWSWAFQRQAAHFAECLRSGAPFRTEAEDALIDLELAEEALGVIREA